MKKIAYIIGYFLVYLLIASCSNCKFYKMKEKKTGWEVAGLKGKVKEVRIFDAPKKQAYSILKFDIKGNLIEDFFLEANRYIYSYDDNGNNIKKYCYNSNGELSWTDSLKYDNNGYLLEVWRIDNQRKSSLLTSYKYDNCGNITEEIHFASDTCKLIFDYDEKGNNIKICKFNSDNIMEFKTTYMYDNKGNEIEECEYDSEGRLYLKMTTKYDENGNETEKCCYGPDGLLNTKEIYIYDDKGNMVEFCRKESGEKRYWKRICKFDEKGYNIEVFTYNVEGRLEERRINKFDKQGNRIEKIETTKDEVNRTIIEYDYYEDH